MNPAQFGGMRGAGPMARPVNVNLPQHLQQQQAQVAQQQAAHQMEQAAAQQAQVKSDRPFSSASGTNDIAPAIDAGSAARYATTASGRTSRRQ